MAGIGFELKKLFRRKGVLEMFRAYGYAGITCSGPMLLGILLLFGILFLCGLTGAEQHTKELLICMITYTMLASLTVTSFFSMTVTRFIADMLFEERKDTILASFWGTSVAMLLPGSLLYGIFLLFSGANALQQLLCLSLFGELIIVWNAMSYLTAIKDYKGILCSFAMAVLVAFIMGAVMLTAGVPPIEGLLFAVSVGYGMMMIWDVILLYRYFPQRDVSAFLFLKWMDKFLILAFTGFCLNIGLFAHLVMMWLGPIGRQLQGLFYGAPYYDVPSLMAFLTILITTVSFVVSVEVNFYPKYRIYYRLFNDEGSVDDIGQAEEEMKVVLKSELKYTAFKQLCATALAVSVGGIVLGALPLGFNDLMQGYFRTLCVGYGLYAIGNTILLLLLYFTDYKGALTAAVLFAVCASLFTGVSLLFDQVYYGFGFLTGSSIFCLAALMRLNMFTGNLPYYILSVQPIVSENRFGIFTKLEAFLEKGRKGKKGEK